MNMETTTEPTKKTVKLKLVGIDGNAFSIVGAFRKAARADKKWTDEEIRAVVADAMSKDYNHLLSTISSHCRSR